MIVSTGARAQRIPYDSLAARIVTSLAPARGEHAILRAGDVRVTTPDGTNLSFNVGNRPITLQDGNASRNALAGSRVVIDREIELPAGVLRVAPLEESVRGVLVIPRFRLDSGVVARNVRIQFLDGRTEISAQTNEVRLGLGHNTELGGRISGGGVRWQFVRNATVVVDRDTLVAAGRLSPQRARRN
jgi:hypothetical protein